MTWIPPPSVLQWLATACAVSLAVGFLFENWWFISIGVLLFTVLGLVAIWMDIG